MLAMGEVVLLSAVFRVIKENLPHATLSIVAGKYACEFLKFIPCIDNVFPIERFGIFMGKTSKAKRLLHRPFIVPVFSGFLKRGKFDCVFIRDDERLPYTSLIRTAVERSGIREVVVLRPLMQKHLNSSRHVVEGYLSILEELGFKVKSDERPVLSPDGDGKNNIKDLLNKHGISKDTHRIIGLCPTSRMKIKEWDTEKVSQFCDMIGKDNSTRIILFSTSKEYVERVLESVKSPPVVIGYLPFGDLLSLTSQCDLFISVDTGPMHVAAALGIPVIGLFGPTSGKMFGPYGKNCMVIQHTTDCPYYRPDSFFSPDEKAFQLCYLKDSCQIMKKTCVDMISPEEVCNAADNFLTGKTGAGLLY